MTGMGFFSRPSKDADPDASGRRRKAKHDVLFIAVILLLVSVASLLLFLFRKAGDLVVVTVNGQLWGEYPLDEDRIVENKNGDNCNVLVIENGRAYVKQASCPDGICSARRPIGNDGESIICLPNRVVVEVRIGDQDRSRAAS